VTARDTLELFGQGFGWEISRNTAERTSRFEGPLRTITVGFDSTGEQVTSVISSDGTFISATVAGVQSALNRQG
jgi:hypothetical protein